MGAGHPKAKDGQLQSVRVGFAGEQLAALDIVDSFGQRSAIRFKGMQVNPALPASTLPVQATGRYRHRQAIKPVDWQPGHRPDEWNGGCYDFNSCLRL